MCLIEWIRRGFLRTETATLNFTVHGLGDNPFHFDAIRIVAWMLSKHLATFCRLILHPSCKSLAFQIENIIWLERLVVAGNCRIMARYRPCYLAVFISPLEMPGFVRSPTILIFAGLQKGNARFHSN